MPNELTMSSLDLAVLIDRTHTSVMKSLDFIYSQLGIDSAEYQDTYRDNRGREQRMLWVTQSITLTLVARVRIPLRYEVMKAWEEKIERKAAVKVAVV